MQEKYLNSDLIPIGSRESSGRCFESDDHHARINALA